mmetsp:Transcript_16230/g.7740  ORF Transcript_16230/g.7740 Transcript_16230/m.7740 type:complete len:293 (-) Transcript_16230:43-921(-)
MAPDVTKIQAKPDWLKKNLPTESDYEKVRALIKNCGLLTVCQEAKCPNIWECFSKKTAAFLIMGFKCTRNCGFCAIDHDPKFPPDKSEPAKVAKATVEMELNYVVVTSVTRDDMQDGGASFFAETITEIRKAIPDSKVEVLVPDFMGSKQALITVLDAKPDVLNHNIETVERLYPAVRPDALYSRSLELYRQAKKNVCGIPIKAGIMLGLGETYDEIEKTLVELFNAGCTILTIGQYLQPTKAQLNVHRFVLPKEFDFWKKKSLEIGFSQVATGPFMRSSYHAKDLFLNSSA